MERFGPTRRGGPVFRWLGEPLAIDLANTVMVVGQGEELDLLEPQGALEQWLDAERDRLGDHGILLRHPAELLRLRAGVRAILHAVARGQAPPAESIESVNAASRAAPITLRLEHRGGEELLSAVDAAAGDRLPRVLGAIARDAIELATGASGKPLRVCEAPSCGMVFIGARRWCCRACGNRARVARHYRRAGDRRR